MEILNWRKAVQTAFIFVFVTASAGTNSTDAPFVYGGFIDPFGISWAHYGYILFLSFWGAAAALFQRFVTQGLENWRLILLRDLTNATLASLLVFLICEHYQIPGPLEAVFSTISAYGGARFMEFMYLRFVGVVNRSMNIPNLSDGYTPPMPPLKRRDSPVAPIDGSQITPPLVNPNEHLWEARERYQSVEEFNPHTYKAPDRIPPWWEKEAQQNTPIHYPPGNAPPNDTKEYHHGGFEENGGGDGE